MNILWETRAVYERQRIQTSLIPGTEADLLDLKKRREQWEKGKAIDQKAVAIGNISVRAQSLDRLREKLLRMSYGQVGENKPNFLYRTDWKLDQTNAKLGQSAALAIAISRAVKSVVMADAERSGIERPQRCLNLLLLRGGRYDRRHGSQNAHQDGPRDAGLRYMVTFLGPSTRFYPGELHPNEMNKNSLRNQNVGRPEEYERGVVVRGDELTLHAAPEEYSWYGNVTEEVRLFATATMHAYVDGS